VSPLSLLFGAVVGLSLGLTGGGGAIFAVPLLVYGLQLPAKDAVLVSLIAVGTTSLVGFLHRWRLGEVEIKTGLLFAVAGMLGAPLGSWIATTIPDMVLMILFAMLMLTVAAKMWHQSNQQAVSVDSQNNSIVEDKPRNGTCQRDEQGRLLLNSRCASLLTMLGIGVGILTGLFGVGGGFVIVPALVLFSGISIHRAVGTSLMVISLVSVSGITSQLSAGRTVPLTLTSTFIVGGITGMFVGQRLAKSLAPSTLQRVFAIAILLVAVFVLIRNLFS
jgi:uncharacterized protein